MIAATAPQSEHPSARTGPDPALLAMLRDALMPDPRIATAIVFGSRATGTARPDSDVDVALLAADEAAAAALREERLDLEAKLSLALAKDVQLVLLDGVDPVLGRQVFLHGARALERDARHTARCLERVLLAYFDGAHHRRLMDEALTRRLRARGRS